MSDDTLRILASRDGARFISRRAFLAGATVTAAGGSLFITGCGEDEAPAGAPSGTSSGPVEDQLNFYNWADYDDPDLYKKFTSEFGPTTEVAIYDSNEQAIAKLNAAGGTSKYDLLCPTGVYIPLLAQQELIEPLDTSRLQNFGNIAEEYLGQDWDPDNSYSVPKDWGTTGYMFDKNVITRPMETWQDFVDAMQNEASGTTSVLGTPGNLCSLYFWTQDPPGDWTTTDSAELDACREYVLSEVAPHVKAYDSYPGITITQGKYDLSMVWNGDARSGFTRGDNPDDYEYVLPGPTTEIWMDTWAIVKNAPNINAAYAWIDFILDVDNSYQDLQYHGYNTAIKGIEERALKEKIPYPEIIFLDAEQVAKMSPGAVNEAVDVQTEIYQEAKAVSAGS